MRPPRSLLFLLFKHHHHHHFLRVRVSPGVAQLSFSSWCEDSGVKLQSRIDREGVMVFLDHRGWSDRKGGGVRPSSIALDPGCNDAPIEPLLHCQILSGVRDLPKPTHQSTSCHASVLRRRLATRSPNSDTTKVCF